MCINTAELNPSGCTVSSKRRHRLKRSRVQVYRLSRKRCQEGDEKDVELKNLKLYLENKIIMEENEKLRKKANILHQENLDLMSEIQEKFHNLDPFPTTLYLRLHKP